MDRAGGQAPTADERPLQRRWLELLNRERSRLEREKLDLERARQSLQERESLLMAHQRLAHSIGATLKRRHERLLARERAVARREEAVEAAARASPQVSTAMLPTSVRVTVPSAPTGSAGAAVANHLLQHPGAAALGPQVPRVPDRPRSPMRDRLPTGTPRLDDLLLGGLPPRSHVALVGDAFVGKEVVLYRFIAEGLKRDEPAILITTTRTAQEVSRAVQLAFPEFLEHDRAGRVAWIDASGAASAADPQRFAPKDSDDLAGLSQALVLASKRSVADSPTGRFRVGWLGVSAVLSRAAERESAAQLQTVLGILRSHGALTMYSLEAGALPEAQVELLLGRMDGAIIFRQERGRTLLSAKGFGGVATRDWVECRATERGLVLGSFALERIR